MEKNNEYVMPERAAEQIPDDRLDIIPGDSILLIVEDDPHYARVIMDLARDRGFKVLVAMRGIDALDLAKQFQPSAVSLDVFLGQKLKGALPFDSLQLGVAANFENGSGSISLNAWRTPT